MAEREKKQPGVMLYFETRNCLKRLDLEEAGRLFFAILNYAEFQTEPDFSEEDDIALCVAWDIVKPKIDADSSRYKDVCQKRREAAESRWNK